MRFGFLVSNTLSYILFTGQPFCVVALAFLVYVVFVTPHSVRCSCPLNSAARIPLQFFGGEIKIKFKYPTFFNYDNHSFRQ